MRKKVSDNFYVYLPSEGRFMEVLGQKAILPSEFEDYDLFFRKTVDLYDNKVALSCGQTGGILCKGISLDDLVDKFVAIIAKKGRVYYEEAREKAIKEFGLSPRYEELLDGKEHKEIP